MSCKKLKRPTNWRATGWGAYGLLAGLCGLLALLAALSLGAYYLEGSREQSAFEELARYTEPGAAKPHKTAVRTRAWKEVGAAEGGVLPRYRFLAQQNSDMVGWLKIEQTPVNYPVMCTPEEPAYYLHRAFDGAWAKSGTPFLAQGCTAESDCVLIYGHNMKNNTLFGPLEHYRQADYWQAHRLFSFDTLTEKRQYEVFAAVSCRILRADEAGFRYYDWAGELTEDSWQALTHYLLAESLYPTGITPAFGEQIVILSTCSYHTEGGRVIIAAHRLPSEGRQKRPAPKNRRTSSLPSPAKILTTRPTHFPARGSTK